MKNVIKFLGTLFLVLVFVSCEKEQINDSNQKVIEGQFDIDLSASKLGDTYTLLDYSSLKYLEDNIPGVIENIYNDIQYEMSRDTNITNTFVDIKFDNGKAYLHKVVYFDNVNVAIISGFELNYITLKYDAITTSSPGFYMDLIASCPSGYTSLGSCSNFGGGTKECISTKVSNYLSSKITGIGDCANIQISVGVSNTNVCGKTC